MQLTTSFNEAGAFPPRKYHRRPTRAMPLLKCFNEAGAFPPRKYAEEHSVQIDKQELQ